MRFCSEFGCFLPIASTVYISGLSSLSGSCVGIGRVGTTLSAGRWPEQRAALCFLAPSESRWPWGLGCGRGRDSPASGRVGLLPHSLKCFRPPPPHRAGRSVLGGVGNPAGGRREAGRAQVPEATRGDHRPDHVCPRGSGAPPVPGPRGQFGGAWPRHRHELAVLDEGVNSPPHGASCAPRRGAAWHGRPRLL